MLNIPAQPIQDPLLVRWIQIVKLGAEARELGGVCFVSHCHAASAKASVKRWQRMSSGRCRSTSVAKTRMQN